MKALIFFFTCCLFTAQVMAQSPNLFNYQGIAKGANEVVLANKTIAIRITVLGYGVPLYSETRSVTTSSTGLFAFQIGSAGATSTSGSLSSANWNSSGLDLKTEMDPNNGTAFINLGTQKWSSVAYAKYADITNKFSANAKITLGNISGTNAQAGGTLFASSSNFVPNPAPAVAASTLTLPADLNGSYSDARPAMYLGNTGTGEVMRINSMSGGVGMILESESTALTSETNSPTSEALRVGNAGNGPAISVNTTGQYSGKNVNATSTGGYALKSSGKVRFQGGKKPPVKGSIAVSDQYGEISWKPTQIACRASGIWGTMTLPSSESEARIQFNVEEYDLGDNWTAGRTFTVPETGNYRITGSATVAAHDDAWYVTPKLTKAIYVVRISNPNGGTVYDDFIDFQLAPDGRASQIRLSGESILSLNKGATVEFFIKAKAVEGYNPEVEDPVVAISLISAWN